MSTIPERLGKYPIVRVLGEGAMGVVYEAFDPVIRRQLAIKTIRRELIEGVDGGVAATARFRNEAQAAGRLLHPGIAAVYEYGEDEHCAFIAMEYVTGCSVREYLSRQTRFADEDVLSIMVQLLEALGHAHAHGVLHRDIKPANLMITRDGRVKVTDFGVARIEASGLTLDGAVIGTPGYIAPEQYTEETIDGRVDVYAAGVLMYQLLAGRTPFTGTPEAVMYKTLHEMPAPPSKVEGAGRPERFDPIVMTALAKSRDERYPSADAFRLALVECSVQPIGVVSEETVVIVPLRPSPAAVGGSPTASRADGAVVADASRGAEAVRARSAAVAQSASAGPTGAATVLQSWDPGVLAEVESRLSRHIGPVARVLVRRAAAACADVPTLIDRLVEDIPAQDDRTQFRTATAALARSHATHGGQPAHTGAPTGSRTRIDSGAATVLSTPAGSASSAEAVDAPLTPDFLAHATRVLAAHVGPIARVLVRKSAERSAGRRAFAADVVTAAGLGEGADKVVAELLRGPH